MERPRRNPGVVARWEDYEMDELATPHTRRGAAADSSEPVSMGSGDGEEAHAAAAGAPSSPFASSAAAAAGGGGRPAMAALAEASASAAATRTRQSAHRRHGNWTPSEDAELLAIARDYNCSWSQGRAARGTLQQRSSDACSRRWAQLGQRSHRQRESAREDARARAAAAGMGADETPPQSADPGESLAACADAVRAMAPIDRSVTNQQPTKQTGRTNQQQHGSERGHKAGRGDQLTRMHCFVHSLSSSSQTPLHQLLRARPPPAAAAAAAADDDRKDRQQAAMRLSPSPLPSSSPSPSPSPPDRDGHAAVAADIEQHFAQRSRRVEARAQWAGVDSMDGAGSQAEQIAELRVRLRQAAPKDPEESRRGRALREISSSYRQLVEEARQSREQAAEYQRARLALHQQTLDSIRATQQQIAQLLHSLTPGQQAAHTAAASSAPSQ